MRLLTQAHARLIDAIFPIRCLGCRTYNTWLCSTCHIQLPIIHEQKCPLCSSLTTSSGETCLSCTQKNTTFIDGVFVVSTYKDPLIRRLLHFYKYRFVRSIATPLALLTAQALIHSHVKSPDIIIPIPLHARRLRWRGFNHAEILARAYDLSIPLHTDILIRKRYTTPQAQISKRKSRLNNLNNAFSINKNCETNVKGAHIKLVDDVSTTGTTLNECARILKRAGAAHVTGIVIAKE